LVYTHKGRTRKVTEKMKRRWQGNSYRLSFFGVSDPIECTIEHPFLTRGRGWVPASGLTTDDEVFIPSLSSEILDKTLNEWERDPEFLWVLGLYLAEGSVDYGTTSGSKVVFSLNTNEISYAERVKDTMKRYGASTTYTQKGENGLTVRVSAGWDNFWCRVFEDLGGKMCYGKKIHQRLMTLDPLLQMNIFDGWFCGDGYTRTRGTTTERVGVSTSRKLIDQMHRILLRNGIYSCIQNRHQPDDRLKSWALVIYNDGVNSRDTHVCDGGIYTRIRKNRKD